MPAADLPAWAASWQPDAAWRTAEAKAQIMPVNEVA